MWFEESKTRKNLKNLKHKTACTIICDTHNEVIELAKFVLKQNKDYEKNLMYEKFYKYCQTGCPEVLIGFEEENPQFNNMMFKEEGRDELK